MNLKTKKEPGHGEKAGAKIQGESVESSFGELEVPKTDKLTETDPVKPHEGVPSQDEPENKKEPDNGNKDEANFLVESVGVESFSGELEVPETDQLTETDPGKSHRGVPRQDEPENKKRTRQRKEKLSKFFG